ncbi:tail assembly protein [Salmonella enterica]|nr:tail assembly protein [Salmonella enterica]ECI4531653.1 tail assembly protein [Salmonella enterica subsp. diarizonae]EBJ7482554.1 tail assembly protein [Salmonella enterica]EDX0051302.1 tail assembly protein [Salmonella enterica]EGF7278212.1 tail assembly protein [Salmonella enterica]
MAATDTFNLEMPGMATLRLYGDLQRFGKRFDLSIKTAAEGLHALYLQIPGLRQKIQEGWYQVRIAGKDVTPDDVTARLHEPLPAGAVIHIVPRMEGAKNTGIFQVVVGAVLTVVGIATSWTGVGAAVGAAGIAMMAGGVVQMLTPTPKSPTSSHADNGKASVYFSSVDNMIAQGNPVPIPYGEIMCGSRVISQEITTRDESTPDKVIHLGNIPFLGRRGREHSQDKLEQQLIDQGLPITKPRVLIR